MLIDINTQVASFRDMLIHIGHDKHDCPELRAQIRKTRRACVESIKVARLNLPQFKRFEPSDRAETSTPKVFVRKSRKFLINFSVRQSDPSVGWLFVRNSEERWKGRMGAPPEAQSWQAWFGKKRATCQSFAVTAAFISYLRPLWAGVECPRVGWIKMNYNFW